MEPISKSTIDVLTSKIQTLRSEEPVSSDRISGLRDRIFSAISDQVAAGSPRGLIGFWQAAKAVPQLRAALEEGGLCQVAEHPISQRVELLIHRESELSDMLPDHFDKRAYLQGSPHVRVR